jgi:transposase InsO family protein
VVRIGVLLKAAGWFVNDKRVERIWRREGFKVPARQPKKGRLWDRDGSCIRRKPERRDHVYSYEFVEARTHEGRKFRMLNVVDEFTRECLAIRVSRKLKAADVIDVLPGLFILRGVPGHVRSDTTQGEHGTIMGHDLLMSWPLLSSPLLHSERTSEPARLKVRNGSRLCENVLIW